MLVSSTFRGLRLHCRQSALSPKPLSIRTIFYPFAPPPTHVDTVQNVSAKTSFPHLPPDELKKVTTLDGKAFEGLVDDKNQDYGTSSSQEKLGQTWLGNTSTKAFGPYQGQFYCYAGALSKFTTPPGRTVNLRHNYSISTAWNVLNSILRINNVRRELRLTARHEQKGEKRRRLRSQRWRRRFAHECNQPNLSGTNESQAGHGDEESRPYL
ncbi:hypothetical protein Clacol_006633 [Clathrus columnatus]|uniref:Uncharacterized protein n=1 Tax=Clathrus columnatus TaxID=1419009 RepID=A0AAV5ACL4_9AGAM|nr:hypothetical protein Clacol_006633 [Clathrus columnatus]